MQYMLLIYHPDGDFSAVPADEQKRVMDAYFAFNGELRAAGKMVAGDALQPIATATSIRVRDGETMTTDGPFAETKEVLGGYYLIEADTLDEALEWGKKCPGAQWGTIEVRPIVTSYETATA